MSHPAHRQTGFGVRFDWGPTGAAAVAIDVEAAVVVDVLSFTTTTVVAVEAGAAVLPWRWRDDSARQQAEAEGRRVFLDGHRRGRDDDGRP